MHKIFLPVLGLIAAAAVLRLSLFTVDRTEFVYLTQFGRHVATYDGEKADEAGLHVKWPWPIQSAQRLDRRLQYFDLAGAELLMHDAKGKTIDKTLTIDAYVCWAIADKDGVDRFIRTVGTLDRAKTILGQRVSSELGAAIGQMELEDLISVEPGKVDRHREGLRRRLLHGQADAKGDAPETPGLQKSALEDYGIEIVDIRLRRSNHPAQVRDAIFARIRSERDKKAADYRSEGEKRAKDIESTALARVQTIEAEALADKRKLEGEGDAKADAIRNQAHARDPQFYAFLKKLEEYQRILGDNRSVLLLSANRELFDTLLKPPRLDGNGVPRPAAGGAMRPKEPLKVGGGH